MRQRVRRHPVALFLVASFGFSWGLWGLMLLSQHHQLPFRFPTNWTGSFGPFFGAVVALALGGEKGELKALFRSLFAWRIGWNWTAFCLLATVAVSFLALALFVVSGHPVPTVHAPGPGLLLQFLLYFLVIFFLGGPLGEEPGWRGFLQPVLHRRRSPLLASVMIGLVWTAWHVPLLYLEGAAQKGASLVDFGLTVFPCAFLFTAAYLGTAGSLFAALLLHTAINTYSEIILPAIAPALKDDEAFATCTTLALWLVALGVTLSMRRRFRPAAPGRAGNAE